jgi:hypothetical protein
VNASQPYQLKDVCVKSLSGNIQSVEIHRNEGGKSEFGNVGAVNLSAIYVPSTKL